LSTLPDISVVCVAAFTVKLGYVQVTEVIFVPAAMLTVWSGAELVIFSLFSSQPVHSATVIPVPATNLSATYQAVGSQASYFTFSSLAEPQGIVTIVSSVQTHQSVTVTQAHTKFNLPLAVNGVHSSSIVCQVQDIVISQLHNTD
jgi:hypothetical protein